MEADESIVQLRRQLDAWSDAFSAMLDSEDRVAQGKTLLRGYEIAKEFDRLKGEGIAIIEKILVGFNALPEHERADSLIRGFELSARLADVLHDEFRDIADGETKVVHLVDEIVRSLNKISPGRIRLAKLLDHPDPSVQSLAGAYLIDLMPERVISVLRGVRENERGCSAGMRALVTLTGWEHGRVSRSNSLND
jgi:hypothetical protein